MRESFQVEDKKGSILIELRNMLQRDLVILLHKRVGSMPWILSDGADYVTSLNY